MIFFISYGLRTISCIDEMISSAGGIVEVNIRTIHAVQRLPPNTYFIISCLEDIGSFDSLIKYNYGTYNLYKIYKILLCNKQLIWIF